MYESHSCPFQAIITGPVAEFVRMLVYRTGVEKFTPSLEVVIIVL